MLSEGMWMRLGLRCTPGMGMPVPDSAGPSGRLERGLTGLLSAGGADASAGLTVGDIGVRGAGAEAATMSVASPEVRSNTQPVTSTAAPSNQAARRGKRSKR
jgi:hypothetical protein